jgi:hypothetical protein
MAKTRRGKLDFEVEPLIRMFGLERVVEKLGAARVAKLMGTKKFRSQLSDEERRELIEQLGGIVPPADAPSA